jgi:hypothetical protein
LARVRCRALRYLHCYSRARRTPWHQHSMRGRASSSVTITKTKELRSEVLTQLARIKAHKRVKLPRLTGSQRKIAKFYARRLMHGHLSYALGLCVPVLGVCSPDGWKKTFRVEASVQFSRPLGRFSQGFSLFPSFGRQLLGSRSDKEIRLEESEGRRK